MPAELGREDHFDLMIEPPDADGPPPEKKLLWTWELKEFPTPGQVIARRLPDHRVEYLDYEGPVSGKRGEVERVLSGSAKWLAASPLRIRLSNELLVWDVQIEPHTDSLDSILIAEVAPAKPGDPQR